MNMSKLNIEYMSPHELIEYENNSRVHSDDQIERIKKSIQEFGFLNPVIIDDNKNIIAGHARTQSAIDLNISEIPVLRVTHLTEAQTRAYIIADNRLAELSTWDNELLLHELNFLESVDFDIGITGFSDVDDQEKVYEEIDSFDSFDEEELQHECPKCGFEFN